MNTSDIFRLNWRDVGRALVMAVIGGFVTPFLIAAQTPGFDVLTADWSALLSLAINGAVIAAGTYLTKNLLSDSDGKVLGSI